MRPSQEKTPKAYLNWRLFLGVLTFGFLGCSRGLDEGMTGLTATIEPFVSQYGLNDPHKSAQELANLKSNITSMVQLGSIGGALFAFLVSDRLGRRWATRQLCLVWAIGSAIYISSSGNLGQLYAGRLIMGLGIGQTVVVGPTYLAEVAPKQIRGACTTVFSGSVFFGIMLGYLAVYGAEQHISPAVQTRWIAPNSMHIIASGLIFIGTFFVIESPRWLLKVGREQAAIDAMSKLRNLPKDHPWLVAEIQDIKDQLLHERESVRGSSWRGILKELFTIPSNLYRIYIGLFTQLLGQWTGESSITIYAPEYFAVAGLTGQSVGLLTTCVFGVVEFIAAVLCAAILVDRIGRKRSLYIGITLQFLSILYIALYVLIDPGAAADAPQTATQRRAGIAAIVAIYLSGIGWALGWNSIQYLINAEIFPIRLRSLGTSLMMGAHFLNQYGTTKAVPTMFVSITKGGTLLCFAVITLLGLIWVPFSVPELAGKSLEEIDAVFELPWWKIGLHGGRVWKNDPVRGQSVDSQLDKEKQVEVKEHADE